MGGDAFSPVKTACYCLPMTLRSLIAIAGMLIATTSVSLSDATIEGQVALPRTHTAPVAVNRYEIVNNHGILATSPPLAIVYLESPSSNPAPQLTKQVAQKNLSFVPALLAVQVGTKVEFP